MEPKRVLTGSETSRCVATITWDELRRRMTEAGVVAPVPLAMIRCLEESGQKVYGYGSRFNTPTGSGANEGSDWDLHVKCTDEEWKPLVSKIEKEIDRLGRDLGIGGLHWWGCERIPWIRRKEMQPVFSNFPHEGQGPNKRRNKNGINVRKINDPETDLFRWCDKWVPSEYTEISHL